MCTHLYLLQVIIDSLLAHEPSRNDLRIAIRQHLRTQHACYTSGAINPPETIAQAHPPKRIRAAT